MQPKIVQLQITLITTIVAIELLKNHHPHFVLCSIVLGFVLTLRSHRAFSATLLVALCCFLPKTQNQQNSSDFELVGSITEGPIFQSGGCRYLIRSPKNEIWNISSSECDGLPNDQVETFIRPSKNRPLSGRAIDFYFRPQETFSLHRQIAKSRTTWINKTASLDHRGLTVALTTGNKSFLEPRTVDLFRDLGLSHLLAISGLHFGIIAAFLWAILGVILDRFPILILRCGKKRILGPAVVLGLYVFLLFVGSPISAIRAFIMVSAYIFGSILSRYIRPLVAVLYALCVLLLYDPSNIRNLGFQLSFCAVIGILAILKNSKLINHLANDSPVKHAVFSVIFVSIAAGLSTLPVLLNHSGQISWISFPLNIVVVPIFSILIFPAILLSAFLFRFGGPVAFIGEFFLNLITNSMLWIVDVSSSLPFLPLARSIPGHIPTLAALALFLGVIYLLYNLQRLRLFVIITLIFGAISLVFVTRPTRSENLHVHFIDVGQGDAIFVQTPQGKRILIDTGGTMFGADPGQRIVAPYLKRLGISKLDAILITHDDTDHNGGLPAILRTLQTDRVIGDLSDSVYLQNIGFEIFQYSEGSKNDRSIVLKYQYGKSCVILSGDIERKAELELADKLSKCSVLKIAHHGSKTSTSSFFLDHVRPAFAIISAGRNNHFGHPHFSVIKRLDSRGIVIFNTQKQGSIKLEMDADGTVIRRP